MLNDLATVADEWLLEQVTPDWFDLYGPRFDSYRLPQTKSELGKLQLRIGRDGHHFLSAIYSEDAPDYLGQIPSVEIMRQVWMQQYYHHNGVLKWRTRKQLPPNKQLIESPYDFLALQLTKRKNNWTGYVVHLTETKDENMPLIITNVETTPATTTDGEMTSVIHENLADKDRLPNVHGGVLGYTNADIREPPKIGVDLCAPVAGDPSWQARAGEGFDIASFDIDFVAKSATCPNGTFSQTWREVENRHGNQEIRIGASNLSVYAV